MDETTAAVEPEKTPGRLASFVRASNALAMDDLALVNLVVGVGPVGKSRLLIDLEEHAGATLRLRTVSARTGELARLHESRPDWESRSTDLVEALMGRAAINPQMLFLDTLDIHTSYANAENIWDCVFWTASNRICQVFATGYSWDFVAGFAQAWRKSGSRLGSFRRLELGTPGDFATQRFVGYNLPNLLFAVEQGIEVR